MQRDGVSRLSAYHHWGMVSPFKIAREAALDKSGAQHLRSVLLLLQLLRWWRRLKVECEALM